MSERIGVLAALLSSTLGGTVAATTRFVVADVDPLTLGALRFGGAFLVLLPVVCALRQPWPKGRDWLAVVLLGGVYFCVYQVLYNFAFAYTSAAHGSMVGATLALMTMVVAALFGVERLSARKTAGVLVATGGVAIALAAGLANAPQGAWRGDLIMLAGIFCWACYNIWSRPFIARSSPLTFLVGGMGVGAVLLVAVCDRARRPRRGRGVPGGRVGRGRLHGAAGDAGGALALDLRARSRDADPRGEHHGDASDQRLDPRRGHHRRADRARSRGRRGRGPRRHRDRGARAEGAGSRTCVTASAS